MPFWKISSERKQLDWSDSQLPYIKDVLIDSITDVSPNESSTATEHALEDNSQISDHIKNNPTTLSVSGVIHDDTEEKVLKLREYREKGEIFTFDYMTNYGNVVITDFRRDYSVDIKGGYAFSMTLKQIKIAKVAKFVEVKQSQPVKQQTKPVTNKGRQQPKKTQKAVATTSKKKYTNTKNTTTKSNQRKVVGGGLVITQ